MPTLKFTEVITFSSEDPNHPADNLLKADTYRKWKCSAALTDKQPTVTLKLEKLSSIRALDIGNEGSAFVEVLVSREGLTNFEVLLVASSFMSPQEARNTTQLNRVRMFGPEKLNKNISSQKWDRIKVVCSQPFNKNIQFGLSFITVQGDETSACGSSPGIKLGAFTIKPEEDESKTSISIGSIFARMREKGSESSPSGAAAIRAAGAAAATKRKADDVNAPDVGFYQLKKKPAEDRDVSSSKTANAASTSSASRGENANGMLHSSNSKQVDREKKHESSNKEAQKKKKEERTSRDESQEKKAKKKPISPSTTPSSARLSPTEPKKRKVTRPFSGLMRDVVFVMSGYQNPQRADLRDKMVEMGAKYKPDWDPKCTHLICAFTNTPKYQQVKGKGKIVSAKWIEECHMKKIRYPWRRYQLEKNRNNPESEDEIWADEIVPKSESPREERREASTSQASSEEKSYKEEDEDYCKEDTDYSDNVDTDDEIERILAQQKHEEKENDNNSRRSNSEDENKADSRARSERSTDSQENDYVKHKGESHKKKRDNHETEENHRKTKHKNSEVKDKNHNVDNKEKHESKERGHSKENSRNDIREERHKHKKKDKHGHEEKGKPEKESRNKEHRSTVDSDIKQEVKEEITDFVSTDEIGGEELNNTEEPTKKVNGSVIKEESEGEEVYEEDTDVDEENKLYLKTDTSDLPLPELGDYLKNKHFFFYGEMSKEKRNLLQRYIVAFDGALEDYMNEAVQFVITECEWDDNFDEALTDNPNLQFVKPQWIWRCSDKKKLVPHQPFLIVPKDC